MIIKEYFLASVNQLSNDKSIGEELWRELKERYSDRGRFYHNLDHLNDMLMKLIPFQDAFRNWDTVVFAVAYHDAIYNPLKSNNEEKSAQLAVERLKDIPVHGACTRRCEQLILATKRHEPLDYETNLFTDADLSILGSDAITYECYVKNIRKEYAIYPDFLYNPGRKKVLLHFLNMARIFKTKEFSEKFEERARKNLRDELSTL